MPYACRVTISGPEPDADGVRQMIEAVASAIEAGWSAPRITAIADLADLEDLQDLEDLTEDSDEEPELAEGAILDYQVFGYTDGAVILVVLDESDLTQASLAVTSLAQHLTTWSPGLLAYAPDEVRISKLDKPHDEENWLPPIEATDEDEADRPRRSLAELMDGDLQELASDYLLAQATWSLWHPADAVESHRARDIVLGAAEEPWGQELTSALGPLIISAARLERRYGTCAQLVVQGAGAPELAADLLGRARDVVSGTEPGDGEDDDEARGHLLLADFMRDHQLLWEQSSGDEKRRNRQLKELLWAGLRVVATMATGLSHLSGPWQVLNRLGGGPIVSALAEKEEEENEDAAADDLEATRSAASALLLIWLATWRPEVIETEAVGTLTEQAAEDGITFGHVLHSVLRMAGSGALRLALEARPAPAGLRAGLASVVGTLETKEGQDGTGAAEGTDDDVHQALRQVLHDALDVDEHVRYLALIVGDAARLTESEENPYRSDERYAANPAELTFYLLAEPAMYSVTFLVRRDEDEAIRLRMLSLAAEVSPAAAGALAADFPNLTGDDPRLEPASRARAHRWVEKAVQAVRANRADLSVEKLGCGADASTIYETVASGHGLPADWPVGRLLAAAAEAAAAALRAIELTDFATHVFEDQP